MNILLFKPPIVHYARVSTLNWSLNKILKELDIPHFSTHSLRHTYATRAIEAGMSPVVLQKLMGHTDVSVTLNAYTSVFDKYKKNELEKVNEYYMEQNLIDNSNANILTLDEPAIIIENEDKKNTDSFER